MSAGAEMLRAGLFSPGWPAGAFPNGIVSYLGNLRPALAAAGVHATILAAEVAGPGVDRDVVDVRAFAGRPVWTRAADRVRFGRDRTAGWLHHHGRAIARAAASRGVDLVEMEESWGFAREVQRRLRRPIVVRLHGPWFLNGAVLGLARDAEFERRDAEERRAVAEASVVTSPSQDVLDRARAHYGLALRDAVVIPYPGAEVPAPRRWSPAGSEPGRVLFVGRFDRHKGGDVVVDAFARMAAAREDVELWFVGPDRGLVADDGRTFGLAQYLEHRLPDRGLRSRLHVLGPRSADEIEGLRRRAAVTVVASRYETFGMVVMEALGFGSPLVATRAGGIPEIVEDGRTAVIVEPGDAEALAQETLALLASPERCAALSEAAARSVRERFSPAAIARVTAGVYRRACGRAERPA